MKLTQAVLGIETLMGRLQKVGMFLMDRHDNPFCETCSEIVLRWRPDYVEALK